MDDGARRVFRRSGSVGGRLYPNRKYSTRDHYARGDVHGFSSIKLMGISGSGPQFGTPGYEVNLLYIAGLMTLVLGGTGSFSVDRLLARRKAHRNAQHV